MYRLLEKLLGYLEKCNIYKTLEYHLHCVILEILDESGVFFYAKKG